MEPNRDRRRRDRRFFLEDRLFFLPFTDRRLLRLFLRDRRLERLLRPFTDRRLLRLLRLFLRLFLELRLLLFLDFLDFLLFLDLSPLHFTAILLLLYTFFPFGTFTIFPLLDRYLRLILHPDSSVSSDQTD